MVLALGLHILAAVIWVGGMFFAYLVLRPSAGPLDPPVRLALWERVFGRFFSWVWLCVAALLGSGIWMVLYGFGSFAGAGRHVDIMAALGIVMMLIFGHLFFAPWRHFRRAVTGGEWPAAGKAIEQIRITVAVNLALGLVTVVIGATGRYWG